MGQATIDNHKPAKMINKGEIADELKKLLNKYIEKGETVRVSLRQK